MKTHNYISEMIFLMLVIVLMTRQDAFAQFRVKPDWVSDPPRGYVNYYYVGLGISPNYQMSIQYAISDAAQMLLNRYDFESYTLIDKTPVADYSRVIVSLHGQKKTVLLKVVDSFVEQGYDGYKTFLLVSSPRPASDVRQIPGDLGAVLKSTLIPGWGQYYKGYPERGIIFLIAEGVALGTAAVLYHKAVSGIDSQAKASFNLAFSIAIGIHILNMIDSVTIKPNIQYE